MSFALVTFIKYAHELYFYSIFFFRNRTNHDSHNFSDTKGKQKRKKKHFAVLIFIFNKVYIFTRVTRRVLFDKKI